MSPLLCKIWMCRDRRCEASRSGGISIPAEGEGRGGAGKENKG